MKIENFILYWQTFFKIKEPFEHSMHLYIGKFTSKILNEFTHQNILINLKNVAEWSY